VITAIDTNILLDILLPNPEHYANSLKELEVASGGGALVICDVVYAELCCQFPTQSACDEFLDDFGIRIQSLSREAQFLASRMWLEYRRRGGKRDRLLADFLVAGHARLHADRLLTRDRGLYRSAAKDLKIVDPSRTT